MTKRTKLILFFLLFVAFCIKEEIYRFLFEASIYKKQEELICETRNQDLEEKYNALLNAYHFEEKIEYHLEYTKILYRDVYNLKEEITIYKGSENNIKEKNLVINEDGLVGIVKKVNKNSSIVELLENNNLNISVKVNNSYGMLKYKEQELIVEGINNKEEIQKNDIVYTSDLSIYPENIKIGIVEEIKSDRYNIEKILKIKPFVHFDELKYISIITDLRGEE